MNFNCLSFVSFVSSSLCLDDETNSNTAGSTAKFTLWLPFEWGCGDFDNFCCPSVSEKEVFGRCSSICRLTFEEITHDGPHDVEWRKPSSEENIVRSSYWLVLFKLRWVSRIWNFISNSLWKENCWYLSEASPAIVMISYICTDIIVSKADFWNMVKKRAAAFPVWNNQESWKFRTCTVKNNYF